MTNAQSSAIDLQMAQVDAALARAGFNRHTQGSEGQMEEGYVVTRLEWDGGGVIEVDLLPQGDDAQAKVELYRQILASDPIIGLLHIRPMVFGPSPGIHRLWLW